MAGQEPRRPQLVRIAQLLGFAAGQRDQPCLGLGRDRGLLARTRAVIEGDHRTIGDRTGNTARDRQTAHTQRLAHRKDRRIHPGRRAAPAPVPPDAPVPYAIARTPSSATHPHPYNSTTRRRAVMILNLVPANHQRGYSGESSKNSSQTICFMEFGLVPARVHFKRLREDSAIVPDTAASHGVALQFNGPQYHQCPNDKPSARLE